MTRQHISPHRQETARAFWAGPKLSPYEELSLLSFVASGARVMLYSPDRSLQIPDGVELVDVHELLPEPVHKYVYDDGDPCLTVHSDLFRYQAVQRHGGWYFDLDIIFIGKHLPTDKIFIARENDNLVNAAIMKFPAGSSFLTAALEEARKLLPKAGRLDIGPDLVTRLAGEYALDHVIQPRSRAYEVRTTEVLDMFDPARRDALDERVAGGDFVHLWNEIWRRIRIPKNYGPPEGSFLDGLFRRYGMTFTPEARLSLDAVESWIHERNRMAWQPPPPRRPSIWRADRKHREQIQAATTPQTVRTFWHGERIGPYQQMCLKSFADRGHRVEVFSYGRQLALPQWLIRRDATEILDPDRTLRYMPADEQFAINANLFRYALLHKLGGWWIDPDVALLGPELPGGEFFIASGGTEDEVATAAIRLPPNHPLMLNALQRSSELEENVTDWDRTGPDFLAQSVKQYSLSRRLVPPALLSSVSRLEVGILFDPAQCHDVVLRCEGKPFLDLHTDVWLRAGIPDYLGPPEGCYLDKLLQEHQIGTPFPARMEFSNVKRWLGHMYIAEQSHRSAELGGA
ncbi:MAG: glycosyltransferase [Pseudolabrys sp.]